MDKFDVWKLELHALRVLVMIHELGTFTAVAERLELNQSTVSYTVDRLRQIFGDELFVRQGRGIAPTARCRELVGQARSLLRLYEDMIEPADFDPLSYEGRFRVSCNPYEECVILPALWQVLRKQAPKAQLSIIRTRSAGDQQLLDGQADLLISPQALSDAGLQKRWLFSDRYVCFCLANSVPASLTWKRYQAASHIRLRYDESWFPLYRDMLRQKGVALETALELPGLSSLAPALAQIEEQAEAAADLVFTAPERLADHLVAGSSGALKQAGAPFECRFDVFLYWPSREQSAPKNRWLRDRIVDLAQQMKKSA